jgi:hypothetical protein
MDTETSISTGPCRDVVCSHVLFNSSGFVSATRTSGSPHFSPAVNASLPPSSNSDTTTSTVTNSTLLQGSSFDALLSPYLSPLQDLDINVDSLHRTASSRATRLPKVEVITNVLETLKKAKLTPLDFLLSVLDQPHFSSHHAPFYNSDKFKDLLRLFWESEQSSSVMKDWLRPHAVHLVCDQIHSEMECAKPYLHMSSKDVTLDFFSNWDICSSRGT